MFTNRFDIAEEERKKINKVIQDLLDMMAEAMAERKELKEEIEDLKEKLTSLVKDETRST